jgi:hypothetical protein
MSVFHWIAYQEGSLGTKWGPCICEAPGDGTCVACTHADSLERQGLDYEEEFEKARTAAEDHQP